MLVQNENAKLHDALVSNLKSAVTASFLMLPESFSEEDLFLQIAGLSYTGDFWMVIGEDKSKVHNIVKDNIQHFRILYSNILRDCPQVVYKPQQGKLEVDKSPKGQFIQLMALPRTLQQKITKLVDPPGMNRDVEEILLQVAQDPDCGAVVQQEPLNGLATHQTEIPFMRWIPVEFHLSGVETPSASLLVPVLVSSDPNVAEDPIIG
ncbi:hypothetical protein fugu_004970 [Takifugu bimaculatus]|uniref:Phosphatidate cytidylyltransferase, mitochondrial n=1 Tax=Takifugu bimaculatus TaxID=433685 RepID=A0A4Z2BB73_9TELE|nr:hypothetical protein fugu_004970 [Takifugu bimaculatus]